MTTDIWPETQALAEALRRLREERDEAIALLREVAVDTLPRSALSDGEAIRRLLDWQNRAAALVRRVSR